jgi:hypothetical protein
MTSISIGEAVGEGFRLIIKRPVSVLAWGAARTALSAGAFSLMAPFIVPFYAQSLNRMANPTAAAAPPAPPDLSQMMAMQGASWLINLGSMVLGAVLYCAIARAVLFPERRAWAYMRLGIPELFLFLLFFGATIVMIIGLVVTIIPIALVAGIAIAAHAGFVAVIAMFVGFIAVIAVLLWLFTRFSLLGAMMVQDGKFHFADAWALTRGRFWSLFLLGMLLVVILIVLEAVIGVVALAIGFGVAGPAIGDFKTFLQRPPAEILSSLIPALILLGVLFIPIQGALYAILIAPWARVYRDLAQPDVAATFA